MKKLSEEDKDEIIQKICGYQPEFSGHYISNDDWRKAEIYSKCSDRVKDTIKIIELYNEKIKGD